jgi:ABC-type multidrug transport system fused ATPase/permease subunit
MFSWLNPMMTEGYKKTLNDSDLLELPPQNRSSNVLRHYRKNKKKHIVLSLLYAFRYELFIQALYVLAWSIIIFGPPYFLNQIIKYIENPAAEGTDASLTPYFFVLGLFITSVTQSLMLQQALYIGRTLGIRIQSIVIGEVYAKALKRRDTSGASESSSDDDKKDDKKDDNKDDKKDENSGNKQTNVNNLLSVDAQKAAELAAYVFYLYSHPLQIIICMWGLYKLLGVSAFVGVIVMIVTFPAPHYASKMFESSHKLVMDATDRRLKIMNELLGAIRIVKFFAWETEFKKRVEDSRTNELKFIRKRLLTYMWSGNIWFIIPVIIMVSVFFAYTRDNILTASTAFTTVALFQNLRGVLDELPFIISFAFQAKVSMERVDKFLSEDEVEENHVIRTKGPLFIGFRDNATFQWYNKPASSSSGSETPERQTKFTLKDLNLSFPSNKLSVVCGPTGSGKTTLLASLLGETACIQGAAVLPRNKRKPTSPLGGAESGIAYVAQSAWLQNASIKDNILFGLPFDQDRYDQVLYMCALTRDLEILEHGDATEVGEKGITLSGGQKQRYVTAYNIS